MSDITDTLAPKSDQLDAVDLLAGPRTFTIGAVNVTSGDQPVSIQLAEFPRVWRPGKSMRRVLAALWGADSSVWAGRRVTLFCDKTVRFGGAEVGGTRISHMSHIHGQQKIPLIVSKGKTAMYVVKPLEDAPAAPSEQDIANATREEVTSWWSAHPHLRPALSARAEVLKAGDA